MERVVEVSVRFELAAEAIITFCDPLEVSLDCPICHRCCRTVVFQEGRAEGKCAPTGHPFPGRIVAKQVAHVGPVASVVYRVAYQYEPFMDAEYPDQWSSGGPTWGRVAFEVACPRCRRVEKASTQTNLVRPWEKRCLCGCLLYTERDEQPVLSPAEA